MQQAQGNSGTGCEICRSGFHRSTRTTEAVAPQNSRARTRTMATRAIIERAAIQVEKIRL
jgi:hypothetical protein